MSGFLDSVVALQHTLDDLERALRRLHGIPDWMQELHGEHAGRKAEIDAIATEIDDAGHERRTSEAEVDDARQKLRRYQLQINEVSTQREYGALLQEIDTVKRQISEGEERAIQALERADRLGEDLAAKRDGFRELDERYSTELAKWEAQKPEVAAEVDDLERRVDELRGEIPKNVLAQFDRLLERSGGAALAPIRRVDRAASRGASMWHCGVCNYRVRPQVVVEIRNTGRLIYCESCKRILYLGESADRT